MTKAMLTLVRPTATLDLFGALFQCTSDALLVVDQHGNITLANDRCTSLLGYEREELLGRPVEFLMPDRFAAHHAHKRRGFGQGHPTGSPRSLVWGRHKSGEEIPLDIGLSRLGDAFGPEALVLASVRDGRPRWESEQQQRLQCVALEAAANGIIITDRKGMVTWANPAITRITGYSQQELLGQNVRLLKSGHHDQAFYATMWKTVLAGQTWFGEMANRRKDGSVYFEEQHIAPVSNQAGAITHFIAIKQDVSARHAAALELGEANEQLRQRLSEIESLHQQLRDQAIRDALTGLHNRRYLEETLPREIAQARRSATPLSVVMMDVDMFKQVNDTGGHGAGDLVLKQLGGLLGRCVREGDIACRLGGDEFLVVMIGAPAQIALERCQAWRRRFAETQTSPFKCSLSAGIAELRDDDETLEVLIKRADEALYRAKQAGRDRAIANPSSL